MAPISNEGSELQVRLSDEEKQSIRRAVDEVSSENGARWTTIALFGSRVDIEKRGGDIDLYIVVENLITSNLERFRRSLKLRLEDYLGEQKMDIVIDNGEMALGSFKEIILRSKVDLWTQKL